MSDKSGFVTIFCAAAVGFAGGCALATLNGRSLIDLAIEKYTGKPLPCMQAEEYELQGIPKELICK